MDTSAGAQFGDVSGNNSELDFSGAPQAFIQEYGVQFLLLCVALLFGFYILRESSGKDRSDRQAELDEERKRARLRQQEELIKAAALHKVAQPTSNHTTVQTPAKPASKSRPPARPPSSDCGYNPLLGGGGGANYRPSGFKKRGG